MDGTIELFNALEGPKKLDIGPYPPMQWRSFIEEHNKMFRWYLVLLFTTSYPDAIQR